MWSFMQCVRLSFPCTMCVTGYCVTETASCIFLKFFLLCLAFKVILNLKSNIRETDRNRQWKRGVPRWNTLLYVELMLWITCSHTSLSPMYSIWFLYDVYCVWMLAPSAGWPEPDIYHYYFLLWSQISLIYVSFLLSRGRRRIHHKTTKLPLRFKKKRSIFDSYFYSLTVHSSFNITVIWLNHCWKRCQKCCRAARFIELNFQYQHGETKQEIPVDTSDIYNAALL